MADTFNFTTGSASINDIGRLSYNGCVFSPLFKSDISGMIVKDNAGWTTKLMEYTLTVDGYVTLRDADLLVDGATTAFQMDELRKRLTQQAGHLFYQGRGNDFDVNIQRDFKSRDVAWGPVPELLDFQPLGAGGSAQVVWKVKFRISELQGLPYVSANRPGSVLQFNQETTVSYDEAFYSTLSVKGTLEVPISRPLVTSRTPRNTVDDYRQYFMTKILASFDLKRFRITKRNFNISRDKRTLEWDFEAEELPYMGLPPNVPVARGSFNFRPAKQGMGLATWLCTLRVTYTVTKREHRRVAWDAFLMLLRIRMNSCRFGTIPAPTQQNNYLAENIAGFFYGQQTAEQVRAAEREAARVSRQAFLFDLNSDEGMYLDSKTTTFSATWKLVTTLSGILLATGLWVKVPSDGGNNWATSVNTVSGWRGNSVNPLNPNEQVIVDFGNPNP